METKEAVKPQRLAIALDIINSMVKNGFTFFSSVFIDSDMEAEVFGGIKDDGYVGIDTLVFHIPGTAALVSIYIDIEKIHATSTTQWRLYSHVYVQSRTCRDVADIDNWMAHAASIGCVTPLLGNDHEVGDVMPYIASLEGISNWDDRRVSKTPSWVTLYCHPGTRDAAGFTSLKVRIENLRGALAGCVPQLVDELAKSVTMLLPVLSTEDGGDGGRFTQIHAATLAPEAWFPKCAERFWDQFNSRDFRAMAKRVL